MERISQNKKYLRAATMIIQEFSAFHPSQENNPRARVDGWEYRLKVSANLRTQSSRFRNHRVSDIMGARIVQFVVGIFFLSLSFVIYAK